MCLIVVFVTSFDLFLSQEEASQFQQAGDRDSERVFLLAP